MIGRVRFRRVLQMLFTPWPSRRVELPVLRVFSRKTLMNSLEAAQETNYVILSQALYPLGNRG